MTSQSIDVGDLSDLTEGEMRVLSHLGAHGVLVCRVEGVLYAMDDNCSHRDASLFEGRLRNGFVTCPLHGAQFDVKTGEHQGPPAAVGIRTYAVHESAGVCSIEM